MSADQVSVYLTGADVHAGPQRSHAGSLGNYRSACRAACLEAHRYAALTGVRIEYVAPLNGPGIGALTAETADTLAWRPPDGTQGAQVTIANGETKILYGGGTDADKYVEVTRTSADDLAGIETVQLLDALTNVIGGSGFNGDESAAGEEKYRALGYVNNGGTQVTDLRVWVDSEWNTNVQLAKETPVANALTDQTGSGEKTQPPGLSWSTPTTEGGALVLGTLDAGEWVGLRIEQFVGVGASADARVRTVLKWRFTEDGSDYYGELRGLHRVAENGIEGYATWIGVGSAPDTTAAPDEVHAALPHDLDTVLPDGDVYYLARGYRNQYGLFWGDIEYTVFRADGTSTPPSVPQSVAGIAQGDGKIKVTASYFAMSEASGRAAADALSPDYWVVYVSDDGDDPDPAVDTGTEVAMGGRSLEVLEWTTTSGYLEEQPVRLAVATRRKDEDTVTPIAITSNTLASPTEVTSAEHGMQVGDLTTISDSTDDSIIGTFLVGTVPSETTFTLTNLGGTAINSATGGTGGTIDSYIRDVDSDLSDVVEVDAEWWGPLRPQGAVSARQAYGFRQEVTGPTETVYIDEENNVRWEVTPGQVELWGDSVKIWTLRYDSSELDSNGLYLEFGLEMDDIDEVGDDEAMELLSWTIDDKRIGVNVAGTRKMLIDVTNSVIKHNGWIPGDPTGTRANVPAWPKWEATCFQVWDRTTEEWATVWELQTDGYATGIVGIR